MVNSLFPANGNFSGRQLRQAIAVFMGGAKGARPLGANSGVRPGTPTTTTVTATTTTWTCQPHAGLLDVETNAIAGPYTYSVDTAVSGALTAPDQNNPRIDIVYIDMADPAEGETGGPGQSPQYYAGVAASTPQVPTPPASAGTSYMVLAQINVPKAGQGSPTVTWVAPFAVAAGGERPVQTSAQLGSGNYDGDPAWTRDTHLGLRWSAALAAWQTVFDPGAFTRWTAYTPSWATVSNGACTVGTNGSIQGWLKKVGYSTDVRIDLTTDTNAVTPAGSEFRFGLPVPGNAQGNPSGLIGSAVLIGGTNLHADCVLDSASPGTFRLAFAGAAGNASATVPVAWQSRTVRIVCRYESST